MTISDIKYTCASVHLKCSLSYLFDNRFGTIAQLRTIPHKKINDIRLQQR